MWLAVPAHLVAWHSPPILIACQVGVTDTPHYNSAAHARQPGEEGPSAAQVIEQASGRTFNDEAGEPPGDGAADSLLGQRAR
jgi:hypothetical protein